MIEKIFFKEDAVLNLTIPIRFNGEKIIAVINIKQIYIINSHIVVLFFTKCDAVNTST